MAIDMETGTEPRVTTLVAGIIGDAQELIKQQLALFKHEIREDFRKTKEAALLVAIGLGMFLPAGISLCLMLVHLLHWAVPVIPLWGSYGIFGGALAIGAGLFLFIGARRFAALNPLPDQSVDALKENVQWLANRK